MKRLVAQRLALLPLLVLLVATVTFAVVQAAPGTYADTIDNPRLTPVARTHLKALYGLDQGAHAQYLHWIRALIHGDLGRSFLFKQPVADVITTALPATILLAGTALAMDLILGLFLALISARRPGGWIDRILTIFSLGIYGLPSFWLAGLAILVFSLTLGWLPASHMASVGAERWAAGARWLDLVRHLILPASILGIVGAASTARYLRASLLDVRRSHHILAARARGLTESRILWVHTLRPALGPLVTLIGLSLPVLVSGSVVVETIFSWPGMGRIMWQAAVARDIPVVMGCTLVGAVAVIIGSLVADLLYAWADPRVRPQ
ncbi:MAG: ABC transporter permease [Acidobacteriota bacterium]